ncbi:hypothetical protein JKP88DRAFT_315906 [Tribonema minus]|uniref:Ankyrin repeat protein n=1 Tax=Tribonema minus TaxID=303371 RepID=A0A835Z1C7_9STRA|nr:hypothetical protein JKP88DRAFT_315906 [Tribonema minus]
MYKQCFPGSYNQTAIRNVLAPLRLLLHVVIEVSFKAAPFSLTTQTFRCAARLGNRLTLRWLRRSIGCIAAKGGHMAILRWLCDFNNQEGFGFSFALDKAICCAAAEAGNLSTLQWALDNGAPCDVRAMNDAARNGHLRVIKFLVDKASRFRPGCKACEAAAAGGHLEVIKYAREVAGDERAGKHALSWDKETCLAAANGGHLHVLRWAVENGCPWQPGFCLAQSKCPSVQTYIQRCIGRRRREQEQRGQL